MIPVPEKRKKKAEYGKIDLHYSSFLSCRRRKWCNRNKRNVLLHYTVPHTTHLGARLSEHTSKAKADWVRGLQANATRTLNSIRLRTVKKRIIISFGRPKAIYEYEY